MNEPPDPLEAELRTFRPLAVSPELRRGIAGRLAHPPARKPRRLWRVALAGGLAASCLAALVLAWRSGRDADTGPAIVGPLAAPEPPGQTGDALPSLCAYRRALARSPEDLDALLDKHAAHASGPDPQLVRIRAFNRPDLESPAILGEL